MSKQANPARIGAFVLGAIALVVVALLLFGGGDLFQRKLYYVMYFPGSVKGLDIGAPVALRGVNIGSVQRVEAQVKPDALGFQIAVYVEIIPDLIKTLSPDTVRAKKADAPIIKALWDKGLRAQLQMQSLVTGKLLIEIAFHPDTPARFLGKDPNAVEFPTIPSALEELESMLKNLPLKEIGNNLARVLKRADEILEKKAIDNIIENLDGTMAEAKLLVTDLRGDAARISEHVDRTLGGVDNAINDVDKLVTSTHAEVEPIATELKGALSDARTLMQHVDAKVDPVTDSVTGAFDQAKDTLRSVDEIVDKRSEIRYDAEQMMQELAAAARSIRVLAEFLERNPDALLRGKQPRGSQ
jgi:paraquat-inducible protein B